MDDKSAYESLIGQDENELNWRAMLGDDRLVENFERAATEQGTTPKAIIREFMRSYLGEAR